LSRREVGDRLEVRRESPRQPHQLDIALRFALEPPARRHAVQVSVNVELEQHRRVIARPAGGRRVGAGEAQRLQVQFLDERVDRSDRVVLGDVVIEAVRQQRHLGSILAFDESLHRIPTEQMRKW